jgi:hypothetical protein
LGKIWRPTARSPREEAAVNAEFDLDCDWSEFEQKIAGLVQTIKARNHAQNPVEEEAWDEALLMLSEGDHYRSVLITTARELHTVLHAFPPTRYSGCAASTRLADALGNGFRSSNWPFRIDWPLYMADRSLIG